MKGRVRGVAGEAGSLRGAGGRTTATVPTRRTHQGLPGWMLELVREDVHDVIAHGVDTRRAFVRSKVTPEMRKMAEVKLFKKPLVFIVFQASWPASWPSQDDPWSTPNGSLRPKRTSRTAQEDVKTAQLTCQTVQVTCQ